MLYEALASIDTPEGVEAFLVELCTPQELRSLEQRLEVARLLAEGEVYAKIVEKTGASSATVSRVKRTMTKAVPAVLTGEAFAEYPNT